MNTIQYPVNSELKQNNCVQNVLPTIDLILGATTPLHLFSRRRQYIQLCGERFADDRSPVVSYIYSRLLIRFSRELKKLPFAAPSKRQGRVGVESSTGLSKSLKCISAGQPFRFSPWMKLLNMRTTTGQ
jgi:hypothetical protein